MGYIFSREIDGSIIPQKVQNLVIRDYAKRNKKNILLSSTEYKIKKSYLMLDSLLDDKNKKIKGIIIYSLYMLAEYKNLKSLLQKIKKNNLKIYCALEEIEINSKNSLDSIKEFFFINKKSKIK